jgi:hypothetical protein
MTQEVKPQDHPDFIGGWVWTELESRWIEERIAEAILHEREACAKVCEEQSDRWAVPVTSDDYGIMWDECVAAIRARGQA